MRHYKTRIVGVERLMQDLDTYTEEVAEGIKKITFKKASKSATDLRMVDMPKATSQGKRTFPVVNRKSWIEYSSGWTTLKENGANYCKAIVHNSTHYQLAHLLELGHSTGKGGRTRAFQHIKPIADKTIEEYKKEVEQFIKSKGN